MGVNCDIVVIIVFYAPNLQYEAKINELIIYFVQSIFTLY